VCSARFFFFGGGALLLRSFPHSGSGGCRLPADWPIHGGATSAENWAGPGRAGPAQAHRASCQTGSG
jgi:hypothetical protein